MAERQYTEKQLAFLDALFGAAQGDARTAMEMAGYAGRDVYPLLASLKDEIIERAKVYMASHGPKAMFATVGVLDDPTQLGAKEKLAAAEKIMDRAGLTKTEKVEVDTPNRVVVFKLPEKRTDPDQV